MSFLTKLSCSSHTKNLLLMGKTRALLLLALLLPSSFLSGSPPPVPELGGGLDKKITSALAAFGVSSVSVAVVQNGQLSYAKAFGKANVSEDRSADASTRYAIGSISKQFTAAALLLEQERGVLSLDDKVAKYFPELTRSGDITIRELLSHTSGYEDYAPQDYLIPEWTSATTPEAILNQWAKKPLNFDPGTRWQYSNTNFVLAGQILEKVSGQTLLSFLQQNFFRPLAMTSAGDCEVHSETDAAAYTRYALGPPRSVGREAKGWYLGAAELCMTASDVARWDSAFLSKKILSARSYGEFTREIKLNDGKATHYALGLEIGDLHGTPMISHSGEVSGFLASNAVFPAKDAAVTILTNEDGVNLIGPLTQMIGSLVVDPAASVSHEEAQDQLVREILGSLQQGRINRALLTPDANSYFTDVALGDYRNSLAPMGQLQLLIRQSEQLRGGMTHLIYHAHFEKDSVALNIYVLPDGKVEQFLVEEQQ